MDAVVFQKEMARMCVTVHGCDKCELCGAGCTAFAVPEDLAKKRVEIVERWSEEHPIMTNVEKFKLELPADLWYEEYKEEP